MSQIVKPVDRSTSPQERFQVFTQADAVQGDILMVLASLGKSAGEILITPTNNMTIRVNVVQTVAPNRQGNDLMFTSQMKNLALSQTIVNDSATPIPITGGTTFVLDIPIQDIELTSFTGNWTIIVK